ncbi:MAG: L,D-transpeptidase family protein [Planctomycetota bacterium]|nr:L,D-transpeptidase family protein [Planctomycetota bacterium]
MVRSLWLVICTLILWGGCSKEGEQRPSPVLPEGAFRPVPAEEKPVTSPPEPQPPPEAVKQPTEPEPHQPSPPARNPEREPPQKEAKKALNEALAEPDIQKRTILLKKVVETYPDHEEFYDASEALSEAYATSGELFDAAKTLSAAYLKSDNEEKRKKWALKMDEWNKKIFFSFTETPISQVYVVQAGDVLTKIGADFNVPYRFIMRINNIKDERKLNIGDRLKIPAPKGKKMEAFVQVDKSEHSLSVFINGLFLKRYAVGLGKDDRTPEGEFTIMSKVNKPSWKGKPYGDPENIIGDWWLGFDETKFKGLGIHGTNDPTSIGKDVSEGCVRLTNEDVDELANTIPLNSKVIIRK